MGLMANIAQKAQEAGAKKSKNWDDFLTIDSGKKKRVRFLIDGDNGIEVKMHQKWNDAEKKYDYRQPCAEHYGKDCEYCALLAQKDGGYVKSHYAWLVYSYDDNAVKIVSGPIGSTSPVDGIAEIYATFETLVDRDLIITVKGEKAQKSVNVINMDKAPFSLKDHNVILPKKEGKIDVEKVQEMLFEKFALAHDPTLLIQPEKPVASVNNAAKKQKPVSKNIVEEAPEEAPLDEEEEIDLGIDLDEDEE